MQREGNCNDIEEVFLSSKLFLFLTRLQLLKDETREQYLLEFESIHLEILKGKKMPDFQNGKSISYLLDFSYQKKILGAIYLYS